MDIFDPIGQVVLAIIFGFIGLCLGSFTSVIIHREKVGRSWLDLKGYESRSSCPNCKKNLGVIDLVPVFSWLFLRGKCRKCGSRISVFYPMIELICGISALLIFSVAGVSFLSFSALLCLPFVISLIYLGVGYKKFPTSLYIITGVFFLLDLVISKFA